LMLQRMTAGWAGGLDSFCQRCLGWEVRPRCRVLDVSTGTGEAARMALSIAGTSGLVIGADISPAMLEAPRPAGGTVVLVCGRGWPSIAVKDGSFDAVVCQLGLQFFPDPARGLSEFRRVLRIGGSAAVCVISTPDRAPMWGILADALSRFLPEHRNIIHLSFALADPNRLEELLADSGFRDIRVDREKPSCGEPHRHVASARHSGPDRPHPQFQLSASRTSGPRRRSRAPRPRSRSRGHHSPRLACSPGSRSTHRHHNLRPTMRSSDRADCRVLRVECRS
jgi:ubiquinone/menaquinone biosynthesis C-methylase UbiE